MTDGPEKLEGAKVDVVKLEEAKLLVLWKGVDREGGVNCSE